MKRRAVLATASTSVALALAGCECFPQTEFSYDITLDEISYDSTAGQWDGQCSLWVNFRDVDEHDTLGISDPGIALYGSEGRQVALVEFDDTFWDDVSEPNRSDGTCSEYRGTLSRRGEFAVSEFPAYFALWYSDMQYHEDESQEALTYSGRESEKESADPSHWRTVEQPEGPFPPLPKHSPELGQRVRNAELKQYSRDCSDYDPTPDVNEDGDNWTLELVGAIVQKDTHLMPGLKRVAIREDEDVLDVIVQMRPFLRPPDLRCDSARIEYTIGIDLTHVPPEEIDVTHRDVDGNELGSYRLNSEDGIYPEMSRR